MDKITYKGWSWPENPEVLVIRAASKPQYIVGEDGSATYDSMSPVCRVITGKGVFTGNRWEECAKRMLALLGDRTMGELIHPVWGTFQGYLTEVNLEEDAREDCVVYEFTFHEADSYGAIPVLPGYSYPWPGMSPSDGAETDG